MPVGDRERELGQGDRLRGASRAGPPRGEAVRGWCRGPWGLVRRGRAGAPGAPAVRPRRRTQEGGPQPQWPPQAQQDCGAGMTARSSAARRGPRPRRALPARGPNTASTTCARSSAPVAVTAVLPAHTVRASTCTHALMRLCTHRACTRVVEKPRFARAPTTWTDGSSTYALFEKANKSVIQSSQSPPPHPPPKKVGC